MIRHLQLDNFTVFSEEKFQFSPHLNVIIGENGTGKTHLLKLLYVFDAIIAEEGRKSPSHRSERISVNLIEKFIGVFGVEELANLVSLHSHQARSVALVEFNSPAEWMSLSFKTTQLEYAGDHDIAKWEALQPVYIPTRELLTLHNTILGLSERFQLPFEEAWRDTSALLTGPLQKNNSEIRSLLKPIEEAIGGQLVLEANGRFYLQTPRGRIEAPLMAEGFRKFAMVAQLIANGAIQKGTIVFWDEPEANLNPKLIREVAATIIQIAAGGTQVFIATHSLFLLRELEILASQEAEDFTRYFGLHFQKGKVKVLQGDSGDDIGHITALLEEINQTDRFLEANRKAARRERIQRRNV